MPEPQPPESQPVTDYEAKTLITVRAVLAVGFTAAAAVLFLTGNQDRINELFAGLWGGSIAYFFGAAAALRRGG